MQIGNEPLNELADAWWEHPWRGIYFGMLADFGYDPYDEQDRPQYRLFFDPPGKWRIEPIASANSVDQYDVLALAAADGIDTDDWDGIEDFERYAASIGCQLVWSYE